MYNRFDWSRVGGEQSGIDYKWGYDMISSTHGATIIYHLDDCDTLHQTQFAQNVLGNVE